MPVWGRRESYSVVTYTLVLLVVIGASSSLLRGLIVPADENDLATSSELFLKRAARQKINWLKEGADPFVTAKQLDRPVLVFAGESSSEAARRLDEEAFSNREVAARLNRQFVCKRVDLATEPYWRTAFLPLTRAALSVDEGYTLWFFAPDGRLVTWIGRRVWLERPDFNDLLGRLNDVSDSWRDRSSIEWKRAAEDDRNEVEAITGGIAVGVPDFSLSRLSPPPHFGIAPLRPTGIVREFQSGRVEEARAALVTIVASPKFDLVDGGFFRLSDDTGTLVEFDKRALENAEMLCLLAKAWLTTGDDALLYAYRRTGEALASQFMTGDRWSSSVTVKTVADGRSERHSLSPSYLRTRAPERLKALAPLFGLDLMKNPLAVPHLDSKRPLAEYKDELDEFVDEVRRAKRGVAVEPSQDDTLDVSASVVARTIEASIAMDDQTLLKTALRWSAAASKFRAGTDDVVHSTQGYGRKTKWLGDYIAYADMKYWEFVATSDPAAINEGRTVLDRCMELFVRDDGSVAATTGDVGLLGPLDLRLTPFIDGSSVGIAELLRVCHRYALSQKDNALTSWCKKWVLRFGPLANALPNQSSAFFASAFESEVAHVALVPSSAPASDVALAFRTNPFGVVARSEK